MLDQLKGPPTLVDLEGALDGNGDIVAWSSQFFIPQGGSGNVPLVAAEFAALPHETVYAPGNIQRNTEMRSRGVPASRRRRWCRLPSPTPCSTPSARGCVRCRFTPVRAAIQGA